MQATCTIKLYIKNCILKNYHFTSFDGLCFNIAKCSFLSFDLIQSNQLLRNYKKYFKSNKVYPLFTYNVMLLYKL